MKPTNIQPAPDVKILINIGAGLDIPTGVFLRGKYGESLLNGGLGMLTGVTAIGNAFKSTIMHYMMLSAANKIHQAMPTSMQTYDTEVNIHESHLEQLASGFEAFKDQNIFADQTWLVTDKTVYYANTWFVALKEYLKEKKAKKSALVDSPFLTRDKSKLMRILLPTFGEIDSFSEIETEDVAEIQNKHELGDSGGNTIHMRQGLSKLRMLMELPILTGGTYHYMLMTAQLGKEMQIASGPMPQAPVKKLHTLKNGDKLKGVTDKFTFLMSNCWQAYSVNPLLNQGTKGPEYPENPDDNRPLDMDLMLVSLRQLRGKSGTSGISLDVVVSQTYGVLPELTEFHYIKDNNRFGISGTLQHYSLDLLPEVKLQRTTVRSKIATEPKLRRALNITSEICQMFQYWRHLDNGELCSPKELYDDLKAQGYDWDMLLNTRGWWTVNNDQHPVPFLSSMDLLNMRSTVPAERRYFPYWMTEDKKGIKPQFQHMKV